MRTVQLLLSAVEWRLLSCLPGKEPDHCAGRSPGCSCGRLLQNSPAVKHCEPSRCISAPDGVPVPLFGRRGTTWPGLGATAAHSATTTIARCIAEALAQAQASAG